MCCLGKNTGRCRSWASPPCEGPLQPWASSQIHQGILDVWRVSCDPSPMFLLNFAVVSEDCLLRAQHELILCKNALYRSYAVTSSSWAVTESKPGSLFNMLQLTLGLNILVTWSWFWGVWRLGLPLLMGSSAIKSPSHFVARCLSVDL